MKYKFNAPGTDRKARKFARKTNFEYNKALHSSKAKAEARAAKKTAAATPAT